MIDEKGRPTLKARTSAGHSAQAGHAVKDRLPERPLLQISPRTTRHLRRFRHFGPLPTPAARSTSPPSRYDRST
ncbi:hypothetical protein [Spongiactinospora rosea]|uniref:hypothetical protein n=1 Tax=Spongiactinospora rosea TaxID=2248750 RepID=UPI0011C040D2|nr:hypothetical protein [Spongiactinospora rosea]